MQYNDQNNKGIEGLLKDKSNIAGLAVMIGSIASSSYVMAARLDEAVRASGYSADLAQQGELTALLGAAAIGAAAFGVGKYAFLAYQSASQKAKSAIKFGAGTLAVAAVVLLCSNSNISSSEADKDAVYIEGQDSYVRRKLKECHYLVDGKEIGLKQSGMRGEIIGNPNLLSTKTQAVFPSEEENKPFDGKNGEKMTLGQLIAYCEAMEIQQSEEVLKKYSPGYQP